MIIPTSRVSRRVGSIDRVITCVRRKRKQIRPGVDDTWPESGYHLNEHWQKSEGDRRILKEHMKRSMWISIILIALLSISWMLLMGYINSRTTQWTIQVDGGVERFSIYQTSQPGVPVIVVDFKGQPGMHMVTLRNTSGVSYLYQMKPAQYFFVTEQGDQIYQGPIICCNTDLKNHSETLLIHALNQWEQSGE
jgi:hypothetical protein